MAWGKTKQQQNPDQVTYKVSSAYFDCSYQNVQLDSQGLGPVGE